MWGIRRLTVSERELHTTLQAFLQAPPFVGMFIARISRGRTVREFVTAVLFIPAGFTFIWMTVFGNTAMFIDTGIAAGMVGQAVAADVATGLFQFFQYLPFPGITSTLAVLLVANFFITSSDSGSLVVDSIAAGGETETTTGQRVFWCVMEGVVAAALLLAGGLSALQSATIASALPFTFVMLGLVWSLYLGMRADLAQQYPQAAPAGTAAAHPAAGLTWQRRLAMMLNAPDRRDVERFLAIDAEPALEQVRTDEPWPTGWRGSGRRLQCGTPVTCRRGTRLRIWCRGNANPRCQLRIGSRRTGPTLRSAHLLFEWWQRI